MGFCGNFFRLIPWASLIAAALSWIGTVLFCAAGHEAIFTSYYLLNSANIPGFVLRYAVDDSQLTNLTYGTVSIASLMFVLSLRFLQTGKLAHKITKSDVRNYIRTPYCSLPLAFMTMVLAYGTNIVWIVITALTAVPTWFFLAIFNQCLRVDNQIIDGSLCLDFTITGLVLNVTNITASANYGRLCDEDMIDFCESYALSVTYRLYIMMFFGAIITCLGTNLFTMIMTANMVYIQIFPKISYYFQTELQKYYN